jgi:hypothetical protein
MAPHASPAVPALYLVGKIDPFWRSRVPQVASTAAAALLQVALVGS